MKIVSVTVIIEGIVLDELPVKNILFAAAKLMWKYTTIGIQSNNCAKAIMIFGPYKIETFII